MELSALKQLIASLVDKRRDELAGIAEQLFRFPETGLQEYRSAALLADILEQEGFRLARGVAGLDTAFRAEYGSGRPTIAILAEMDALPGLGHACGHNVIAAAAIGAAIALRHAVPPDQGRIIVLGTPAEELGIGKVELVKAGVFQGVDAAIMVHPSSRRLVIKHYLGLARLRFTFFGRPAHAAAYPEEGVNALDGVIQTFNGISALRQQLRQDVRVHGIITDGGVAPNIIPATASCYFYVRATDLEEVGRVRERVIACAEGAARATGCQLEVDVDERVLAPLKVNHTLSGLYSEQLAWLGLAEATAPPDKNIGSSDIGNVSQVVPTIHPHVPIGAGIHIHTEDFARATVSEQGRQAVVEGATAMALTAVELIVRAELRKKMWDEFTNS